MVDSDSLGPGGLVAHLRKSKSEARKPETKTEKVKAIIRSLPQDVTTKLAQMGLKPVTTNSQGNSIFEAVALQAPALKPKVMRQELCNYGSRNIYDFTKGDGDTKVFEDVISKMAQDKYYDDKHKNVLLSIISKAFRLHIAVVSTKLDILHFPEEKDKIDNMTVVIAYHGKRFYGTSRKSLPAIPGASEQASVTPSSARSIDLAGLSSLNDKLVKLGLEKVRVLAQGNCMFDAVSKDMPNMDHLELRKLTCDYINDHLEEFRGFISDDYLDDVTKEQITISAEEQLIKLRNPNHWNYSIGDIVVEVIHRVTGRHIVILHEDPQAKDNYFPEEKKLITNSTLVVVLDNNHFWATKRKTVQPSQELSDSASLAAKVDEYNRTHRLRDLSGLAPLAARLDELGLVELPVSALGNCMFEAISIQIPDMDHTKLRELTCDYIANNMEECRAYILTEEEDESTSKQVAVSIEDQLKRLKTAGQWNYAIGDIGVEIIHRVTGRNIAILSEDQRYDRHFPMNNDVITPSTIVVILRNNHFTATKRKPVHRIFYGHVSKFWLSQPNVSAESKQKGSRPDRPLRSDEILELAYNNKLTQMTDYALESESITEDDNSFFTSIARQMERKNIKLNRHVQATVPILREQMKELGKKHKGSLVDTVNIPQHYDTILTWMNMDRTWHRDWELLAVNIFAKINISVAILHDGEPVIAEGCEVDIDSDVVIVRQDNGYYSSTTKFQGRVPSKTVIKEKSDGAAARYGTAFSQMLSLQLNPVCKDFDFFDCIAGALNLDGQALLHQCVSDARNCNKEYPGSVHFTMSIDEVLESMSVGIWNPEWERMGLQMLADSGYRVALLRDYQPQLDCFNDNLGGFIYMLRDKTQYCYGVNEADGAVNCEEEDQGDVRMSDHYNVEIDDQADETMDHNIDGMLDDEVDVEDDGRMETEDDARMQEDPYP